MIPVAVICGVLYWFFSPFLFSSSIGSTIPQAVSSLTEQVQPVITYVQENALQVGSLVTAGGGAVAVLSSKIYKSNIQKKEIEVTAKMNEVQGQYFQLDAEKRGLENALEQAKSKITMLEDGAITVKDLTVKLSAKDTELQNKITEVNLLTRQLNDKSAEKLAIEKFEELKKVP